VARHDARVARESARWLVRSRERTNFTYDLTALNREHLAWYVADLSGASVGEIRGFMLEIETDTMLADHVLEATATSPRRRLADRRLRLGKRIGWYALIRAIRPAHVVETGTDKGLGSCVLAAALLRNGIGSLTTIDTNPDSGYLISGRYAEVVDRVIASSIEHLARMSEPVDLFIHDSLHTWEYETAEFEAVHRLMTPRGLVVSDNAHATDALPAWAETTGRRFSYFGEQPAEHWYPGAGIGTASPG